MTGAELLAALDGYRLRQGDEDQRMAVTVAYLLNAWVDTSKTGKITPERILGKPPPNQYNEAEHEARNAARMASEGVIENA